MKYLMLALFLGCRPDKPAHTATEDSATEDDSAAPVDPLRDTDGDGTPDSGDCSPGWASIGPNVEEIEGDGLDQNCDGLDRAVTDIRNVATQFWGESDTVFGEEMSIAHLADSDLALIGQPVSNTAGRIYVIGHPEDPMRRLTVQDLPSLKDDHLGRGMTAATVEGTSVVVAPYVFDSGEQFLAGWALDNANFDLGPSDLLFNTQLSTGLKQGAGHPHYGPDLNQDAVADLFF
jgi:hypothetical protein